MKVVGIVCEYNPLHRGHEKQFAWIRRRFGADTAIVCVMSGQYVQRGAPAVMDKAVRARAAVLCGANLVLELPVTKALSSAEGFAAGGVAALDALGCVDAVCFGAECGDLERLTATARALLTPEYTQALRRALAEKASFASARQQALEQVTGACVPVTSPNDILAVEYCKAILQTGARLEPVALRRSGDYHAREADAENPSATALRGMPTAGWRGYVPEDAMAVYEGAARYDMAFGERAVLARLRTLPDEAFAALPFGSEGLWRRFARACREGSSVGDVIARTKSKRYARSRVCRMVLCAYLGISQERMQAPFPYLRALAVDQTGIGILHRCKTTARLPIVNAGERPPDQAFYRLEERCADLFSLFIQPSAVPEPGQERKERIFCRLPGETWKR